MKKANTRAIYIFSTLEHYGDSISVKTFGAMFSLFNMLLFIVIVLFLLFSMFLSYYVSMLYLSFLFLIDLLAFKILETFSILELSRVKAHFKIQQSLFS